MKFKRKFLFSLVFVLIMAVSLVLFGMSYINSLLEPVDSQAGDDYRYVTMPPGATAQEIAVILEEAGLIHSSLFLRLYLRFQDDNRPLIAGEYSFSPSMTLDEILDKLRRGIVEEHTVRFTVPEGLTVEQIAARLNEQGLVEKEKFLEIAREPDADLLQAFCFLKDVPETTDYFLDGYLFPNTYEIEEDATEKDIVRLMLGYFSKVFDEEYQKRAAELGMSIHEIVTLASIIEREAVVDSERPLISAVFHNRLKRNYPLESCATVQYALGEVKPVLTNEDTKIESSYNTYKITGLPPGPIAAPGLASIEAALYPADVDYFFFVAKEDGTGEHYFSRTLEEHNSYKLKVQQNR
jgi:UPF0755 protein